MAIGATINKVSLSIADMDRHYYQTHELTAAQHPSENNFRFIVRIIAYALNACENLVFTKGISTDDEPDIWLKSLSDEIELWIELGQVDEKRIRKACGRAKQVLVYTYDQRKSDVWWKQTQQALARYSNLQVFHLQAHGCEALVQKNMNLQCNIQDGELTINDNTNTFYVQLDSLL